MIYLVGRTRAQAEEFAREQGWSRSQYRIFGSALAVRGHALTEDDALHLLPRWSERRDADQMAEAINIASRQSWGVS